jgi:hypothetical protein
VGSGTRPVQTKLLKKLSDKTEKKKYFEVPMKQDGISWCSGVIGTLGILGVLALLAFLALMVL